MWHLGRAKAIWLNREQNLKRTHFFICMTIVKQDIIFMLVTFFVCRMSWLLRVWNMDLITAHQLDGMRSVLFVYVKILNWLLKILSSYWLNIVSLKTKFSFASCLSISFCSMGQQEEKTSVRKRYVNCQIMQ